MAWFHYKNWDEKSHRNFYQAYRSASKKVQAEALVKQAEILSLHLDETTLKAAESLLILWIKDHFSKEKAAVVYGLLSDICQRIGDHNRAKEFRIKKENLGS